MQCTNKLIKFSEIIWERKKSCKLEDDIFSYQCKMMTRQLFFIFYDSNFDTQNGTFVYDIDEAQ